MPKNKDGVRGGDASTPSPASNSVSNSVSGSDAAPDFAANSVPEPEKKAPPAPKQGRAPSARYRKAMGGPNGKLAGEKAHFLKGYQLGDIVEIAPAVEGQALKSEDGAGKVVTISGKTRTRLQPVHVKLIQGQSLKLLSDPKK